MVQDPKDNPNINRKLLKMLDNAIEEMKAIKPFGFFSKQLIGLRRRFGQTLQVTTDSDEDAHLNSPQKLIIPSCNDDEKLVYFRLFHREMNRLDHASRPQALNWLKPLINSINSCEKRGLAVYATEDEARRSTRNKNYCYVGVKIKKSDDVTAKRSAKKCAILGCPLLVIADLDDLQLFKLTYNDQNFPIVNGEVLKPLAESPATPVT